MRVEKTKLVIRENIDKSSTGYSPEMGEETFLHTTKVLYAILA
jgi:hypothetical protein